MAAISASRHFGGTGVVLLSQANHVGGMMSGGLGLTDTGGAVGESLIGGLALDFFTRVGAHYGSPKPEWYFEPHVAETIFLSMLSEAGVQVEYNITLQKVTSTPQPSPRIIQVVSSDGRAFGWSNGSSVFIDASYEGDLLAQAGASYAIGREGKGEYGEDLGGVREYSPLNQFYVGLDPFDAEGKLLPLIYNGEPGTPGQGDEKVEAYNFRLCLTQLPNNSIPFTAPSDYDPKQYELFRRYAKALGTNVNVHHFFNIGSLPNKKTDVNNGGPLSTDCIGCSWSYPSANNEERDKIWKYHESYTKGLLYFLANDPDIPPSLRDSTKSWGYCADEFKDNGGFPNQLYVRESRRMVGDKVFTQINATQHISLKDRSIGCGAYNFDSHHVQRVTCQANSLQCEPSKSLHPCCKTPQQAPTAPSIYVIDEGDVQVNPGVFEIPYDTILPKQEECQNLLVPVCVSASHIGFCCLRLEPQFMIMGHSSGVAAVIAFKHHLPVQQVDTHLLYSVLKAENQILSHY
uniref:Uncharacterized protein n=1 Tax=Arcella intermedia TaxID=1963864 RepID=A0A6B2L154_9EUKA|eukprot:TRINITY_DN8751_c0_g1_i1.p1 TRINITY_DN8751_c0_g1~~TRINITY_DN8751_c0_g1_i1.p1  ORF type:complete len:555 (-),score=105.58 TRINITY_DN8751_c0_g1_i1:8-1558(-)